MPGKMVEAKKETIAHLPVGQSVMMSSPHLNRLAGISTTYIAVIPMVLTGIPEREEEEGRR